MLKKLIVRSLTFLLTFSTGALPFVITPLSFVINQKCGMVHGKMNDGGGPLFFISCTSGKHFVIRASEGYKDAAKAESVFNERIRTALTVYEQNQKVDGAGRIIGRRAVVDLTVPETGQRFTSIFWTDDNQIVSIDSTSQYYALFLEWMEDK